MKIIGFEGGIDLDDLTVTYGAAALQRGDRLINAVLRYEGGTPMSEWPEYVKDGHVAELPEPVDLPHDLYDAPCYVMVARTEFAGLIIHFAQMMLGNVWAFPAWPDTIGMIFPSFDSLKIVADVTPKHIRDVILTAKDDATPEVKERWTTASRILDPWDGLGQKEWVRQFSERLKKRREDGE
jgi:hypothetical protein